MIFYNKRGDIAITLLVFMALVMAVSTLFIFYTHDQYVSSQIQDARFLDELYIKENKFDFYMNEAMDKSVLKITDSKDPAKDFLDNLKFELSKYKINGTFVLDELSQADGQITSENVVFDGKVISISLNINFKSSYENKFLASSVKNMNYSRVLSKGF